MNEIVGKVRVGQWYRRLDKGETFLVTAYDQPSGTIEMQSFDGDVDEVDESTWSALPLEFSEPPEDWSGPLDVEPDDVRYSETAMGQEDWDEALQPNRVDQEAWEEATAADERDAEGEGQGTEEPLSENPSAARRLR